MSTHYWNDKRQKIYDWMVGNNLESYAHLYKGAVMNLSEKTPGYVRFVAHAVRDMTNGMAAHYLGRSRSQVQYVAIVDELGKRWETEGLPKGSETLTPANPVGGLTPNPPISISEGTLALIQNLLREHGRGRQRSDESPFLFFQAFLPNPTSSNLLPQAYMDMWKDLQKWFQSQCHENGKLPEKTVTDQIETKFVELETIILTVADGYTNTIRTVDEILERANS